MKKKILIVFICILALCSLMLYKNNSKKHEIVYSGLNNSENEKLAFYIQDGDGSTSYNIVSTMPAKEDGYILGKYECSDATEVSLNYSSWSLIFSNIDSGSSKCNLYFDVAPSAGDVILANKTISERTSFDAVLTTDTTGTIYSAEDDDGTSYYFAGAPTDNYLKFANHYWRIIRINGDGSIRLIYAGNVDTVDAAGKETILANGYNDSSTDYLVTNTAVDFNTTVSNNMYAGFMYTSGNGHGYGTSSTIKGELDTWYTTNLASSAEYLDVNAGFCNDRTSYTNSSGTTAGGGTGTTATYYAGYIRLQANKSPSLKCTDSTDLFTISSSNKGNNALTNPIGLITADEVSYAGGLLSTANSSYYLYAYQDYYTMTPHRFASSSARMFYVGTTGRIYYQSGTTADGVRPVINLNGNVILTGSGTIAAPYEVVGIKSNSSENSVTQSINDIISNKNIVEKTDFSAVLTTDTTGTIYSAEDNDGTSYYYAGAPTDNYVKFAGYYWRIIRINGDGTIRLIYDGTTARTNGTSSSTIQIETNQFNSSYTNNEAVGYLYTSGSVHGLGTESTVKGILDNWYSSNLSSHSSYISYDAGFCGDRQASTDETTINNSGGTGGTTTYYAGYIRLYTNKSPSLKCAVSDDLYTTSSSSKGNKALTNPIGLITADEIAYAGGVVSVNNSAYYLYTGQDYWTITPSDFYADWGEYCAGMFILSSKGALSQFSVNFDGDIRPVINLKANVLLSGNGTARAPYVVVGLIDENAIGTSWVYEYGEDGTFEVPFSGKYSIELHGGGGGAYNSAGYNSGGGGSGELYELTLIENQQVAFSIGVGGASETQGGTTTFGDLSLAGGGAGAKTSGGAASGSIASAGVYTNYGEYEPDGGEGNINNTSQTYGDGGNGSYADAAERAGANGAIIITYLGI